MNLEESSLVDEGPEVSALLDETTTLTFEIVKASSLQLEDKLTDSQGFTYHFQRKRGETSYCQCTV